MVVFQTTQQHERTRNLVQERERYHGGSNDATTNVAADNLLINVLEKGRVTIALGKVLNDHGPLAPFGMNTEVRYKLRLSKAKDIMFAQAFQSVAGYTLEDIKLEYSTIESSEAFARALVHVQRRQVVDVRIRHDDKKKLSVAKGTTLINETINPL